MGQTPAKPPKVKGEIVQSATKKNKGSGKGKKLGRNKQKCAAYKSNKMREKHKIIKIARSSGVKAAMKYADEKGVTPFAIQRLKAYKRRVPDAKRGA